MCLVLWLRLKIKKKKISLQYTFEDDSLYKEVIKLVTWVQKCDFIYLDF